MLHINKPALRNGQWSVVISESRSPVSKEIKVIICPGGKEAAYQAYRRLRKEQGKGL